MSGFRLDTDYITRTLLVTGFTAFGLLIITAPAAFVETRTFNGINLWIKPLKFDLSILVHAATIAILVQQLTPEKRAAWSLRILTFVFVPAAILENVYITIQAMRGRASHFNYDTVFESLMYAIMGLSAVILVLLPFVIGVFLAFQRDGDRSGLRLGTVIGLLVGPILTLVYGGYMSMSGSHFVGASPGMTDAGGSFLFGWSRDVGDMRPAHFVALHMIQALPLIGLAVDVISKSASRVVVLVSSAGLAALSTFLFFQALAGQPFWPR